MNTNGAQRFQQHISELERALRAMRALLQFGYNAADAIAVANNTLGDAAHGPRRGDHPGGDGRMMTATLPMFALPEADQATPGEIHGRAVDHVCQDATR